VRRSTALKSTLVAVLAACLPAAIVVAVTWGHQEPAHPVSPPARSAPAPSHHGRSPRLTAAHPSLLPSSGLIATASRPLRWSDRPGGAPAGVLAATNPYGQPQTLAVVGRPSNGWAEVELPLRPNGRTGWVPLASVRLTWTPYSVAVSIAARRFTLYRGSTVVLSVPATVGAPTTYTPRGHTFLWELIKVDNPAGAYGPYIFGLAEFSNSYISFNGGDAQIGLHGTDEPWTIGAAASHGCVRLDNAVISELAGLLPLGTPVVIS
jgi:lipoprotein-anchoring transpeptidase ErfK/SrfK